MSDTCLIATWSFALEPCARHLGALRSGADPLDVVQRIVADIERDPDVDSVGRGGLPDADGHVTLDAIVMRSPSELGAVAGLRDRLPAIDVARAVMDRSPYVLIGGEGADRFADEHGVGPADLLTDRARTRWEAWTRDPAPLDQSRDARAAPPRPIDRGSGGQLFAGSPGHDTVCVLARGARGDLVGATSTSGTPWKDPGRIGDSPIVGHGVYVHPRGGAAAATGTGELAMGSCSSYHVVERMRGGASPEEAIRGALERVLDDFELAPHHQLALIAIAPDGTTGSGAIRPGYRSVVATTDEPVLVVPSLVLLPEDGEPEGEGQRT